MSEKFEYTDNSDHITDEQRKFYEENGYLIIRNLVDHDLLDQCQQRFLDIINERVPRDSKMSLMKDVGLKKSGKTGEYMYYKINDFLYDDIFFKYVSDKKVVDVVKSIIGHDTTACHSMFINKPPDAEPDASRHPLHQDLHYFPFRPAHRIVASWTALERIDEQNGCLFGVPGTHKGELYAHTTPDNVKNPAFHGVQNMDHLAKVNFVMEKGDTIFFHPILLHGSGPNYTKGFRRAISAHYADSNCEFYDVTGTSQENIAKEVKLLFKKRGYDITYHDVWRWKSRLVSGRPGNFQKITSKF